MITFIDIAQAFYYVVRTKFIGKLEIGTLGWFKSYFYSHVQVISICNNMVFGNTHSYVQNADHGVVQGIVTRVLVFTLTYIT